MGRRKAAGDDALLMASPVVVETEHGPEEPGDAELQPWFEMHVADRQWRFMFTPADALERMNGGTSCWAVTLFDRAMVVFDASLKRKRPTLQVVLHHELTHVGLGSPIASGPVVASIFGARTAAQADDREEQLASYLSNNLAGALFATGLMRLPKVPR